MSRVEDFFDWCPMPQPPPQRWRHFYKPIIAIAALTTIIATSLLASSFSTFSASVAAPMADQVNDQVKNAITAEPTPTPTPTPTASASPPAFSTDDNTPATTTVQPNPTYTVSGYVLDAYGNGIEGAEVIFCVPDIIPAVFTNASGYYQASAPQGTYHVYVWPPFDSNYISFEQKKLVINSDVAKNMTLNAGYKLSGYINFASGQPIRGAVVALNDFYCNGYYSIDSGYYYVVAPAGTYTLSAHPKTGANFPAYTEANVVLSGDLSKNITVQNPTQDSTKYKISGYIKDVNGNGLAGAEIIFNVPNIIPGTITNGSGYYEVMAPAGTYHVNIWPPFDSNYLSYDQLGFTVAGINTRNFTLTQGYKVSGYITDSNGNPVFGAIAALGNHIAGWYSKETGYYFVTAPAGTYTLTVQPRTGPSFTVYTLSNVAVNGNIVQNITVTG